MTTFKIKKIASATAILEDVAKGMLKLTDKQLYKAQEFSQSVNLIKNSEYITRGVNIDINGALGAIASAYHLSSNPSDYIFIVAVALHANEPNENADAFSDSELTRFDPALGMMVYESFRLKPHFIEHKSDDITAARGFILDAHYADDDPNDKFVELVIAVDKTKDPAYAQAVESGKIRTFSMGCTASATKCAICNNVAVSPLDFCDHVRGKFNTREIEGKRVFEWCLGVVFDEISAVADPADTGAIYEEKLARVASRVLRQPQKIEAFGKETIDSTNQKGKIIGFSQKTGLYLVHWMKENWSGYVKKSDIRIMDKLFNGGQGGAMDLVFFNKDGSKIFHNGAWETLPKGWTEDSLKSMWDSLTGDHTHKITECIKKMEKHMDDPGAFCASLARKLESSIAKNAGLVVNTGLINAVEKGDITAVKAALDSGADPNAQDSYGKSALMRAINMGHQEIVDELVQRGAVWGSKKKKAADFQVASDELNSIIEEAMGGDEEAQKFLETVFEEPWDEAKEKLETEGSAWEVWYEDGVRKFVQMQGSKKQAGLEVGDRVQVLDKDVDGKDYPSGTEGTVSDTQPDVEAGYVDVLIDGENDAVTFEDANVKKIAGKKKAESHFQKDALDRFEYGDVVMYTGDTKSYPYSEKGGQEEVENGASGVVTVLEDGPTSPTVGVQFSKSMMDSVLVPRELLKSMRASKKNEKLSKGGRNMLRTRKTSGTWALPYKEKDAQTIKDVIDTLKGYGDQKITDDVRDELYSKIWNVYGDDELMDQLDKNITGTEAAQAIRSSLKEMLKHYESAPGDFSDKFDSQALDILKSASKKNEQLSKGGGNMLKTRKTSETEEEKKKREEEEKKEQEKKEENRKRLNYLRHKKAEDKTNEEKDEQEDLEDQEEEDEQKELDQKKEKVRNSRKQLKVMRASLKKKMDSSDKNDDQVKKQIEHEQQEIEDKQNEIDEDQDRIDELEEKQESKKKVARLKIGDQVEATEDLTDCEGDETGEPYTVSKGTKGKVVDTQLGGDALAVLWDGIDEPIYFNSDEDMEKIGRIITSETEEEKKKREEEEKKEQEKKEENRKRLNYLRHKKAEDKTPEEEEEEKELEEAQDKEEEDKGKPTSKEEMGMLSRRYSLRFNRKIGQIYVFDKKWNKIVAVVDREYVKKGYTFKQLLTQIKAARHYADLRKISVVTRYKSVTQDALSDKNQPVRAPQGVSQDGGSDKNQPRKPVTLTTIGIETTGRGITDEAIFDKNGKKIGRIITSETEEEKKKREEEEKKEQEKKEESRMKSLREYYAKQVEAKATKIAEEKIKGLMSEYEKVLIGRWDRALRLALKRQALNLEQKGIFKLKMGLADALCNPSTVFAGMRPDVAVTLIESAFKDSGKEIVAELIGSAQQLMTMPDDAFIQLEADVERVNPLDPLSVVIDEEASRVEAEILDGNPIVEIKTGSQDKIKELLKKVLPQTNLPVRKNV